MAQQIIWAEEYSHAEAPARVNHMGENLLGPTLIEYGTRRAVPADSCRGILRGEERWCQGYSEPNAGSDLANVQTRAVLDEATGVGRQRPEGVDLARPRQPLVLRRRPHRAAARRGTGACRSCSCRWTSPASRCARSSRSRAAAEFNETFFTDARTPADLIVGVPGDGWRVAMGLLGFERGISTLAQQVGFERELRHVDRPRPASTDGSTTRSCANASPPPTPASSSCAGTRSGSMGSGVPGPEASISKLFWGTWHRDLGELLMDVIGAEAMLIDGAPYELTLEQKLFLFTPVRHDLWRLERDPAQRARRAGARPAR